LQILGESGQTDANVEELPDRLNLSDIWRQILSQVHTNWPAQSSRLGEDVLREEIVPLDYTQSTLILAVATEDTKQRIDKLQPNLYWLLAQAVANVLVIAGEEAWARDVNVQIVVDPRYFSKDNLPSSAAKDPQEGSRQPAENPSDDFIEVDIDSDAYTNIVHPKRIITIPSGMFRWLPILGPLRASMVVAIYQELYLKKQKTSVSVSLQTLATWAGTSKITFMQHMHDPELSWFFSLSPRTEDEKDYAIDPDSGIVKKLPNRYSVSMTLPLPPGDELALIDYLERAGIHDNPEKAIKKAASAKVSEILPEMFSPTPPGWTSWQGNHTVSGIVHSLLGNQEITPESEKWISALSNRLMPENKNSVNVCWHRFQKWFPILGQERGWFTILCDWRTYHSENLLEIRDVFKTPGYEWFARYLGVNDRTVRLWFQFSDTKNRRHGITDTLSRFVRLSEIEKKQNKVTLLLVKVVSYEPLTPDEENLLIEEPVTNYTDEGRKPVTNFTDVRKEPVTNYTDGGEEPVTNFTNRKREPVTHFTDEGGKPVTNYTKLNNLRSLNYLKPERPTSTTTHDNKAEVEDPLTWNYPDILSRLTHNPIIVKKRLADLSQPTIIIAWLLYSASPAGEKIGAGYIVKQLEAQYSPGDPFDELASFDAEELLDLFSKMNGFSIYQFEGTKIYELFKKCGLNKAKKEKIEELVFRLTGK